MAITKAIFAVAGYGTRFLPATKAQPKEMLPIVDKPIIQYLVEEAVNAGIQDIIFVTGRGKTSIENHFDHSVELEVKLVEKKKDKLAEEVNNIANLANFAYVRQPVQRGDGDAILCAKPFIDHTESVLVVFPDYLMPSSNRTMVKMIDYYRLLRRPIIAADKVPMDRVSDYGVMSYTPTEHNDLVKVESFVEKPKKEEAPSNLINAGFSIITPEVLKELETAESTAGDSEIRLADAFVKLTKEGREVFALVPEKHGYDCGSKSGYLQATVDYALARDDLKDEFTQFLINRVKTLSE